MSSGSPSDKDYFNFDADRANQSPTTSYAASKTEPDDKKPLIESKEQKQDEAEKQGDQKSSDEKEKEDDAGRTRSNATNEDEGERKTDEDAVDEALLDGDDKDEQMLGPGANPGHKEEEESVVKDDKSHHAGVILIPSDFSESDSKPADGKAEDEPEEMVCLVRCLYYSMQCCECAIS